MATLADKLGRDIRAGRSGGEGEGRLTEQPGSQDAQAAFRYATGVSANRDTALATAGDEQRQDEAGQPAADSAPPVGAEPRADDQPESTDAKPEPAALEAAAPPSHLYYVTRWLQPAGKGASNAQQVEMAGYAKTATSGNPFVVVNEFIAWKLGVVAGLPIPPGALLVNDQGDPAQVTWVSLNYLPEFRLMPDVDPAAVVAAFPELAAGVIAFDYIIANTDRNAGNLALIEGSMLASGGIEQGKRLEIFDHSHALAYKPDANKTLIEHLSSIRDHFVINGNCLLPHVTSAGYLLAWAGRLQERLTDAVIREACWEAPMITGELTNADAQALANLLRHRRDMVAKELHAHAADFKAIPADDWPAA